MYYISRIVGGEISSKRFIKLMNVCATHTIFAYNTNFTQQHKRLRMYIPNHGHQFVWQV